MNRLACFQPELKEIHDKVHNEINFKTASFEDLVHLPLNELENNILPAIVLTFNELVDRKEDGQKTIHLACIFQYIFLAHKVHGLVKDYQQPQHERQYPVLVGDFLFGQAFNKICQEGLFSYTKKFTEVIETMSEGVLLRWSLKSSPTLNDLKVIVAREKGALTSQTAGMTAELLELPPPFQKKVEEIGFCIGMAWGFWDESANLSLVQEYLERIKELTLELKQYYNVEKVLELNSFLNEAFLTGVKLTSK